MGERKLLNLICSYCGKEFQGRRSPSNIKSKTYCSPSCRAKGMWSNPNFKSKVGSRAFQRLVKQLDAFGLGYISAFLDGEGSVFVSKLTRHNKVRPNPTYYSPCINFYNNDRRFLEKAMSLLGCGTIYMRKPAQQSRKAQYALTVNRLNDVTDLLRQLLPYLIVKHKMAQAALAILNKEAVRQ